MKKVNLRQGLIIVPADITVMRVSLPPIQRLAAKGAFLMHNTSFPHSFLVKIQRIPFRRVLRKIYILLYIIICENTINYLEILKSTSTVYLQL